MEGCSCATILLPTSSLSASYRPDPVRDRLGGILVDGALLSLIESVVSLSRILLVVGAARTEGRGIVLEETAGTKLVVVGVCSL